ncbi:Gfo/Idh/MocA family oxidoreductase [Horticoccus luteus]|uniref:Gfo/Idh/MocA family oxidoreductase n=1 Tax=Horticoccus luteus TaxID=2862869 RepID=A0A8F9TW35_9BACT|nr:Gfo/Idh/MocA family oxidoreductase [Horticoccus luteus]QYM79378.1 Gfo/Idh/MocA family oxidoreductase [Horticoccus luteus]
MHSVLIVGCGSIGERHLRCFQRTGRAHVTACEANPALLQRMADTYGVATRTDATAALAEPFDAVVVCTPAPSHLPLATAALAAGKHVLVEKPLSHSLAGLDLLEHTLAQSRRQLAVAYVYHVFPALREARAFLAGGEFGPVLQAVATSGQAFNLLRPAYAQTYYRDHRTGGGAIQDALTHLANWVESVLGPTDSVLTDCAHLSLAGVEVEDTVHVAARHGAALASYTLNQFQAPNETTLQFNAAGGSVRIELHRQRWGVFPAGAAAWTWHQVEPAERDTHFIAQANAFLDQLEGQPPRLCSLAAAAQTLRFNLAALASAASGSRVFCRDIAP